MPVSYPIQPMKNKSAKIIKNIASICRPLKGHALIESDSKIISNWLFIAINELTTTNIKHDFVLYEKACYLNF